MFKNHWKEEVSELVAHHELHKMPAINALGYKLIAEFLTGKYPELSEEQLIFQIQKKTRFLQKNYQTKKNKGSGRALIGRFTGRVRNPCFFF